MLPSLATIAVAAVLVFSGAQKALDTEYFRAALRKYPMSALSSEILVYLTPSVEVLVAAMLVAGLQPTAGIAAALLFLCFALLLATARRLGARHDCGCFGRRVRTRVGGGAIARSVGLLCASLLTTLASEPLPWYVLLTVVCVVSFGGLLILEAQALHGRLARVAPTA